ncbi:uncharacterized protein L203_100671 [Cryptococcus depauperatus CBS 7841]|uniref:Dynactin 2 n=1 Tax=Cryptococcus depauperatus CBS 7841 TaxID=1295531 RepID=A0AAJ8JNI3_9TREE
MTTKYMGLPDIVTPDVFETGDEPEILLKPSDISPEDDSVTKMPTSEYIDGNALPSRRKVEQVFARGTKRSESSTLSFRPRLPRLSHYDINSSDSEDEFVSNKETPAARLRRLKAELAEVEAEIGTSASTQQSSQPDLVLNKRKSVLPPKQSVDVVKELAIVRERLEQLDFVDLPQNQPEDHRMEWKQRLEMLSDAEHNEDNSKSIDSKSRGGPSLKLGDIDKRLATLEHTLGPVSDIDQTSPLVPTLNRHAHLLTLLTQPRHLDAISRRVKLLLVDLDRAAAASRRNVGTAAGTQGGQGEKGTGVNLSQAEYSQLQSVFAVFPRLDPLLPILPPLLARLQSLSALHAEASEIASTLQQLQLRDKKSHEEIKELKVIVESVQKGLDESIEGIKKNWEGLEGRMKSLEERLGNVKKDL